jgi:hypothetical protein
MAEDECILALDEGIIETVDLSEENLASTKERLAGELGGMLPYLIIIFCFTGSMYPAIDLAAGEKERGTMQTLLCAPVSPVEIVTGKFFAVWITSLIAAFANIVSLGTTVMRILPGESISVSPAALLLAFAMLLPVTFFITAVFLAGRLFGPMPASAIGFATLTPPRYRVRSPRADRACQARIPDSAGRAHPPVAGHRRTTTSTGRSSAQTPSSV